MYEFGDRSHVFPKTCHWHGHKGPKQQLLPLSKNTRQNTRITSIQTTQVCVCSYVPVFQPSNGQQLTEQDLNYQRTKSTGMIREMDQDGDGLISRDEFRAILTDSPEMDSLTNYDMRLMPAVDEEMLNAVP
jgi:hypothetical protein